MSESVTHDDFGALPPYVNHDGLKQWFGDDSSKTTIRRLTREQKFPTPYCRPTAQSLVWRSADLVEFYNALHALENDEPVPDSIGPEIQAIAKRARAASKARLAQISRVKPASAHSQLT